MNKHELEARLRQVRREKDSLEQQSQQIAEHRGARDARSNAQWKEYHATRERELATGWGRVKEFFGIGVGKLPKVEDTLGALFGDALIASTGIEEKFEQLEIEEGRILDELKALRTKPQQQQAPPTREERFAAAGEEITKMRRDRGADLEKMRQDGGDEESVRFRENMWNDAIRRKEEERGKLM